MNGVFWPIKEELVLLTLTVFGMFLVVILISMKTTKEAAVREVYEENRCKKFPEPFFWKFTDSPKENRQM